MLVSPWYVYWVPTNAGLCTSNRLNSEMKIMANQPPVRYCFHPLLWTFATTLAAVWTITLVNFERDREAFRTEWQQSLNQACASRRELCSSLQFTEEKGWISIQRGVWIHAHPVQMSAARNVILDAMTPSQRSMALVQSVDTAAVPPTSLHSSPKLPSHGPTRPMAKSLSTSISSIP